MRTCLDSMSDGMAFVLVVYCIANGPSPLRPMIVMSESLNGQWNKNGTSVKIVLSYRITISVFDSMKKELELHEIIGLAILAGAFINGLLMGLFTL